MVELVDRTVKVTYSARYQEFVKGTREAAQATRELGSEGEKLAQTRQAFDQLGQTGLVVGGILAAGVGIAVAKFAEFDQAMSNVLATGEDARDNQVALRQAAIDAGSATVFSATESANAIEEMAKAGVSAADVLSGGLTGALDLAAAGGLGVARAAEISATALQQFGLDGSEASHVADVLAAGAGKAMGSVDDLANGLKFVGPVAAAMGISIEETTGTLALFAQQGIIGEQAGTSLRGVLSSLTAPSVQAREEIKRLGITLYDSQGNFLGLQNAAGQLAGTYRNMDDASRDASLGIIFGRETITAATALYKAGAEGVADWTSQVDDSGYAAETAAQRLDNLKGDIEAFTGALETAFITMGSGADGPGRFLVQWLTDLVDGFNDMPTWGQQSVFWIGAVGAAAFTAGGLFLVSVPKIVDYKNNIEQLGVGAQRTARVFGAAMKFMGAAAALTLVITGLEQVGDLLRGTEASVTDLSNTLSKGTLDEALAESVKGTAFPWEIDRVKGTIRDLGGVLDQIGQGRPSANSSDPIDVYYDQLAKSVENLGEAFASLSPDDVVSTLQKVQDQYGLTDDNILTLINSSSVLRDKLIELADGMGLNGDDATLLALALGDIPIKDTATDLDAASEAADRNATALALLAGEAQDTETDIDKLSEAVKNFGAAEFDVRAAAREFETALDDLQQSITDNGNALDITTEKGRANEAALDAVAQGALDLAGSLLITTKDQDQAAAAIQNGRDRLIEALGQFGITGQAAEDYADKLGLIPSNITTAAGLSGTDEAIAKADRFRAALDRIAPQKTVTIEMIQKYGPLKPEAFPVGPGKADGGAIYGPGTGTSDTAGLFRLSNGEHVWTAAEVAAAGGHTEVMRLRKAMLSGEFKNAPGYATGGAVALGGSPRTSVIKVSTAGVNLDGASISGTLQIGGDGLARLVDGRISMNADARRRDFGQGVSRG